MVILNFILNHCSKTKLKQTQYNFIFQYYCTYIQGQRSENKIREYFYYIDHLGMLFLDDTKIKNFTSCFKDKKFLSFFFKRLQMNETNRYKEFPYLSLCGRERNYVRCDDLPIVFTHILEEVNKETGQVEYCFSYNYAHEYLMVPFQPNKIFMSMQTGRIYHPALEHIGGIGLVKSSLAIEFSSLFDFKNGEESGPTSFRWNKKEYEIDSEWYKNKISKNR